MLAGTFDSRLPPPSVLFALPLLVKPWSVQTKKFRFPRLLMIPFFG